MISNAQFTELQKSKTTRDGIVSRYGKPRFHSDNLPDWMPLTSTKDPRSP